MKHENDQQENLINSGGQETAQDRQEQQDTTLQPRQDATKPVETAGNANLSDEKTSQRAEPRVSDGDNIVHFPAQTQITQEHAEQGQPGQDTLKDTREKPKSRLQKRKIIALPREIQIPFFSKLAQTVDDGMTAMLQSGEDSDQPPLTQAQQLAQDAVDRRIPATDEEDTLRRKRQEEKPKRKQVPLPPDQPPKQLAQAWGAKLGGMRVRRMILCLVTLVCVFILLVPQEMMAPYASHLLCVQISTGVLALGILLGYDVIVQAARRLVMGRVASETFCTLALFFTLADGILLSLEITQRAQMPFCAVVLVSLFFHQLGQEEKMAANRLSCRVASAKSPYRVTLDEKKWAGYDTFSKWQGTNEGFGSQILADDGAQIIFRRVYPVLLVGAICLGCISLRGVYTLKHIIWVFSAVFTAGSAFGGAICFGRSFYLVARRLERAGAALAGWHGIKDTKTGLRAVVTDGDLFPPGAVSLEGVQGFHGYTTLRALTLASSMLHAANTELSRIFVGSLHAYGGEVEPVDGLEFFEGGICANLTRGRVCMGTLDFMYLTGVEVPKGVRVRHALFCAVNGQLVGQFILRYTLPSTTIWGLEQMMRGGVEPILATRDQNLIPTILQKDFKIAANKMEFPPVVRRYELSDSDAPHNPVLIALFVREGIKPFAETVTAARRLTSVVRAGAMCCCIASAIGIILSAYLASFEAYSLLSGQNLLCFSLLWLLPVWFFSSSAHRY